MVAYILAAVALSSLAAGCGSIGAGDECSGAACGSVDAAAGSADGAAAAQDAAPAIFHDPEIVEMLVDPVNDDDPSMTEDRLELYFNSSRVGGLGPPDIWRATRNGPGQDWDPPEPVDELNSTAAESDSEVSADGLTILFSSTREPTVGGYDLYVATRETRDDPWGKIEPLTPLNSSVDDLGAATDASGTILVFHSARGNTGRDLYMSTRETADDPWGDPEPMDGLNSELADADPFLSPDGKTLYFNSTRIGGKGDSDIFVTWRASLDSFFVLPEPVEELNSELADADLSLTPDGTRAVFTSNRSGNNEIWESSR